MKREVAATRAAVVGVVTAALHMLVVLGYVDVSVAEDQMVTGVIDAIGGIVATLLIRHGVTPKNSPRDRDGNRLERASLHDHR